MTIPKIKPCPKCGNTDLPMYGYGDYGSSTYWRVECDDCHYMGPAGNKLQAVRMHNERCVKPHSQLVKLEGV